MKKKSSVTPKPAKSFLKAVKDANKKTGAKLVKVKIK